MSPLWGPKTDSIITDTIRITWEPAAIENSVLTIKRLYGILIPVDCMIMKIAFGFPAPIHIGIQPVIEDNRRVSLISISKREILSFNEFVMRLKDKVCISTVAAIGLI